MIIVVVNNILITTIIIIKNNGKCVEGVMHLAYGCQMLAGNEYLKRHNSALKVLIITWAVVEGLLKRGQYWHKLKWEQGSVIENDMVKLCWTLNIG